MTTNAAPPGWHPDPSNPGGALRWWDGAAWTQHTHQPATPPAAPYAAATAPAAWPNAGATTTAGFQASGHSVAGYAGGGYSASGYSGAGGYPAASGYPASPYARTQQLGFAKQNTLSLTAIGVVALYIVIALSTRVVILGILPVMLSIRAINRKESLGPVAVVAAIVAVGIAFVALK